MSGSSAERATADAPFLLNARVWIYMTVTLMSVLVVYEGWSEINGPWGIVTVVVGPTIAVGLAHSFADLMHHHISHSRGLSPKEWQARGTEFLQFLLVAVPPLIVLAITATALQQRPVDSVRSMLLFGFISLGFWGGLAGWQTGLRGWRLVAAVVAGLLLGGLVFLFQLALKPH